MLCIDCHAEGMSHDYMAQLYDVPPLWLWHAVSGAGEDDELHCLRAFWTLHAAIHKLEVHHKICTRMCKRICKSQSEIAAMPWCIV